MLIWLDLETTGLTPEDNEILEIGVIVTDDNLIEHGRFHALVAPAVTRTLESMHPVVQKMHTNNKLWSEINQIPEDCTIDSAETQLLDFLEECGVKPGEAQLAGSTISFDRAFVAVHMPRLAKYLHYRNVDVTSFNEIARRSWPGLHMNRPVLDRGAHRADVDIQNSLDVMRYYVNNLSPERNTDL